MTFVFRIGQAADTARRQILRADLLDRQLLHGLNVRLNVATPGPEGPGVTVNTRAKRGH